MSELDESIEQVQALIPDESVKAKSAQGIQNPARFSLQSVIVGLLVIGFFITVSNQFEALFGPAERTLIADARALLQYADSELHAEMLAGGVVPSVLPSTVPPSLVTYAPKVNGYALMVRVNGQVQGLQRNGSEVTFDDE